MATTLYAGLAEFKAWLEDGGITLPDSPSRDELMQTVLGSASRTIDGMAGRFFYQLVATIRTYTADDSGRLSIDDLVVATALATDLDGDRVYETAWAATDYDLTPDDAPATGWPYTAVATAPNGTRSFGRGRKGVQIVGTWGWPAVPDAIATATLILASRVFRRKDSPFGVAGSSGIGEVVLLGKTDPDVAALVAPYRRRSAVAV